MNDPLLDRVALGRFLADADLCSGPVEAHRIGEGYSNPTYLVDDGTRRVVLRRPPAPPYGPRAHDVVREARIQRALAPTPVPVATILAVEPTGSVLGVPFYVMEHLDGAVVTTHTPPAIDTPAGRRGLAESLVDTLVELHRVDASAVGLGDLGRPSSDVEGYLRRFARIIDPESHGLDGEFGAVLELLLRRPPVPREATIVHGDFRLGNVMSAVDGPPRLLGVLDWELTTLGDPLRDLGYLLATYAVPGEPINSLTEMSTATLAEGYPGRDDLARRYADRSGRDLSDIGWYLAAAMWKVAVLYENQSRRAVVGVADPYFAVPGRAAGLVAAARRLYESPFSWSLV